MRLHIPSGYSATLDFHKTQKAIKKIKALFEYEFSKALNLSRITATYFVRSESGLNDNLSGKERPIRFDVPDLECNLEIVHSLAKWKRIALKKHGYSPGEGIYTDMNAIRRDEVLDNTHSLYVDQWDWEKIIRPEERNIDKLYAVVRTIFEVFKVVETSLTAEYPTLHRYLPSEIKFISSQDLEDRYPSLTAKEREDAICKEYGAVFLTHIGGKNRSGKKHDNRAPDYDDWNMNGDMLFFYPVLGKALEMSSMGVRVNADSLLAQVKEAKCEERLSLTYHQDILNNRLPQTIGGGLGQSRMCMFLLGKAHVGEVQSSIWPDEMVAKCEAAGIPLI